MERCQKYKDCEIYRKNQNLRERVEKLAETVANQRNELRLFNEGKRCEPILKAYIKKYGCDSQCKMAIEEMSELMKEICKGFRGEENVEAISEEMADVEIMLDQMKIMYGNAKKVDAYRKMKIERMVERFGR